MKRKRNKEFGKFEGFNFPENMGYRFKMTLKNGFYLEGPLSSYDPFDDVPNLSLKQEDKERYCIEVPLEELDTMFIELDDGTWVEILPGDEMPVRR